MKPEVHVSRLQIAVIRLLRAFHSQGHGVRQRPRKVQQLVFRGPGCVGDVDEWHAATLVTQHLRWKATVLSVWMVIA
jgi:hypothetical protein